jgi:hypothetical protein
MNETISSWLKDLKGKNQNTYKFCLQLAILENLSINNDGIISIEEIIKYFHQKYWDNTNVFNINESNNRLQVPEFHQISRKICKEFKMEGVSFSKALKLNPSISMSLEKNKMFKTILNPISRLQHDCKTLDAGGLKNGKGWLYSWDLEKNKIEINPNHLQHLDAFREILKRLTVYEWAKFIEKYNSIPAIINKLEFLKERESFKRHQIEFVISTCSNQCFYCEEEIDSRNRKSFDIDHFIPYAYIFGNPTWDLVASCIKCNRGENGKFDKLPTSKFLHKILRRNELEFKYIKNDKEFDQFNDLEVFMKKQYENCKNSGFLVWKMS